MNVTIKEKQYEFIPDFPNGWQFSKGDYLKFPVEFGVNRCFVKRFNTRTPGNIPGWEMLNKLKGKHAANLPRVYDIQHATEQGSDIYYVFYEYVDGKTLHQLKAAHSEINLYRLTDDILHALKSLHKHSAWFADFDERNILLNERGLFYLVDVDKAQPVSAKPDFEMWGNKEYWVLVFNYYRFVLQQESFTPGELSGPVLNYLQVIFLVLRLKIYDADREKEEGDIYSELPASLNLLSPAFKAFFSQVQNEQQVIAEIADQVGMLIKKAIIPITPVQVTELLSAIQAPEARPVINSFTLHNYASKSGKEFVVARGSTYLLRWDVAHATGIALYENDHVIAEFAVGQNSITLTENKSPAAVAYKLVAFEGSLTVASEPILVNFRYQAPVIHEFTAGSSPRKEGDLFLVEHNVPFKLQWKVDHASEVQMLRNGKFWKTFTGDSEITLIENYESPEAVVYELIATNPEGNSASANLPVHVKDPSPVIERFSLSAKRVAAGADFTLSWKINQAEKIALLKDGLLFKELTTKEGELTLQEHLSNGRERNVEFTLRATNRGIAVEGKPLLLDVVIETPVISDFRAGEHLVQPGETINLNWKVSHADKLELYSNGELISKPDAQSSEIRLPVNVTDPKNLRQQFVLSALNGLKRTDSEPVVVQVQLPLKRASTRYLQATALLALILVMVFVAARFMNTAPASVPVVNSIEPAVVYEDSLLTIRGVDLPGSAKVMVGGRQATISSHNNRQLVVGVPGFSGSAPPDSLDIQITDQNKLLYRARMAYAAKQGRAVQETLPAYLSDIWSGDKGLFLSINLNKQLLYLATNDKQHYTSEKIRSYVYDKTTASYRIVTAAKTGYRLLILKSVSTNGFEAAVCPTPFSDSAAAVVGTCNDYQAMSVYYDNKPGLIYLPVQLGEGTALNVSERSKFQEATGNGQLIKSVTVFHANRYLAAPEPGVIRQLIQLPADVPVIQAPSAHLTTSTPFQRNFMLVDVRPGTAVKRSETTAADCNKIFRTIRETKTVGDPSVICKLDLSAQPLKVIPREVFTFTNLKWLNLGGNKIKKVQLVYLKKVLPGCKVVFKKQR